MSRSTPSSFSACNLLAEGVAGLGKRDLAQRLDANAQRADGSGHQRVEALRRLASHPGAHAVDFSQLIQTSVLAQAKRIGAKGVCFYDLGSGLQVLLMDAANQVGLREVQLVVAAVDENAFGVQQGAHGAVAKNGAGLQAS